MNHVCKARAKSASTDNLHPHETVWRAADLQVAASVYIEV